MTLGTVLLILLILLLVGALPTWPHSREWGYVPSGGVGLVLLVLLILVLMGRSRPAKPPYWLIRRAEWNSAG